MTSLQTRLAISHAGRSVSYLYRRRSASSQPYPVIVWGAISVNHSQIAAMSVNSKFFCLLGGLLLKFNYPHPYKAPGNQYLAKT